MHEEGVAASSMQHVADLAEWMMHLSWMLEKEPTRMAFRSPRSTAPYQMLTCKGRNPRA